eukprot:33319-Rhodomonas_salina.2
MSAVSAYARATGCPGLETECVFGISGQGDGARAVLGVDERRGERVTPLGATPFSFSLSFPLPRPLPPL